MSEPSEKPAKGLLSAFDLGPAWARKDAPAKKSEEPRTDDRGGDRRDRGRDERREWREPRGGDDRRGGGGGGRGGDFRERREGGGGGGRRQYQGGGGGERRDFNGPRELPQPAEGVRVTLSPAGEAVHLVVREIHHLARVYSLYDVAQILLAGRERYRLHFSIQPARPPVYAGKKDASLWLTKEEAIAHFWESGLYMEFYESDEVETEPPAGNFQVVARCGLSGEWLGPPNFHGYQSALRRIHRERFSHMAFEAYSARVRSERGEEAVNAWLDTMRKRRRYRVKSEPGPDVVIAPVAEEEAAPVAPPAESEETLEAVDAVEGAGETDASEPEAAPALTEDNGHPWTFDRGDIERDFVTRLFPEIFAETHETEMGGDVPAKNLSPGLLACVRIAGSHARKHAAILIPAICRLLEGEHLAVFKREGKLFTGPARPHPLSTDAKLAERPSAIVAWIESQTAPKLSKLWEGVLPDGGTEPPQEWLADLFWLLTQGHVLLFSDDSLVLPKRRHLQPGAAVAPAVDAAAPKGAKKKKRKKRRKPRARKTTKVVSRAKLTRSISRMSVSSLRRLHTGPGLLLKRHLIRRGKIAALRDAE